MILGALAGSLAPQLISIYEPVGELFVRFLKFLVIPLVLASLVGGVVAIGDSKKLGSLGLKTLGYFVLTSVLAISLGLSLALLLEPGAAATGLSISTPSVAVAKVSLTEIIVSIIPTNPFQSLVEGQMLSVIFIAFLIGFSLLKAGDRAKNIISFFDSLDHVMMVITDWIIKVSPFGIFALLATMTASTGLYAFLPLVKYIAVVLIGLFLHGMLVIPSLVLLLSGKNPFSLFSSIFSSIATAFSSASSAAAFPMLVTQLEKKQDISGKTISFVLPLGITINMNGTALYQAVAAIFLAQYYGLTLSIDQLVVIIIITVLASVGAAGVPSAGLVTLTLILTTVGIPVDGIALIIGVDRLLDMCRTTINLWGNACACVILDQK